MTNNSVCLEDWCKTTKRLYVARFNKLKDERHGAESKQTFHVTKYERRNREILLSRNHCHVTPERLIMQHKKCSLTFWVNSFAVKYQIIGDIFSYSSLGQHMAELSRPSSKTSEESWFVSRQGQEIFLQKVQIGSDTHPGSYWKGTGVLSLGLQRPNSRAAHYLHLVAEVKNTWR
jgi:hypothetical protein